MTADASRDTLEFVREIRATPDRVFRAFTTPKDLFNWWGKGEWPMTDAQIDLKPGGRWRLDFKNPQTGAPVSIFGEYKVVDPPRRLSMTWFGAHFPGVENFVEILLEPIPTGTRLTLRHSGLAGHPDAYKDYEEGWPDVLGHLIAWAIALTAAFAGQGTSES